MRGGLRDQRPPPRLRELALREPRLRTVERLPRDKLVPGQPREGAALGGPEHPDKLPPPGPRPRPGGGPARRHPRCPRAPRPRPWRPPRPVGAACVHGRRSKRIPPLPCREPPVVHSRPSARLYVLKLERRSRWARQHLSKQQGVLNQQNSARIGLRRLECNPISHRVHLVLDHLLSLGGSFTIVNQKLSIASTTARNCFRSTGLVM